MSQNIVTCRAESVLEDITKELELTEEPRQPKIPSMGLLSKKASSDLDAAKYDFNVVMHRAADDRGQLMLIPAHLSGKISR